MPLTTGDKGGWTSEQQFIVSDPDGTYSGAAVTLSYFRKNNAWYYYTAKTANYTVPDVDDPLAFGIYLIDCTSGTFTVTLPDATADNVGRTWVVVNSGAGTITVTTTGGTQIVGNDTVSTSASLAAGNSISVMSTGSGYRIF